MLHITDEIFLEFKWNEYMGHVCASELSQMFLRAELNLLLADDNHCKWQLNSPTNPLHPWFSVAPLIPYVGEKSEFSHLYRYPGGTFTNAFPSMLRIIRSWHQAVYACLIRDTHPTLPYSSGGEKCLLLSGSSCFPCVYCPRRDFLLSIPPIFPVIVRKIRKIFGAVTFP